jgi:hypothetical protein
MCLNFGRTSDESECATVMAAWRFRFANLKRVVFSVFLDIKTLFNRAP